MPRRMRAFSKTMRVTRSTLVSASATRTSPYTVESSPTYLTHSAPAKSESDGVSSGASVCISALYFLLAAGVSEKPRPSVFSA